MAGIMANGLLGLIMNGVQNVQEGLPFLASQEEKLLKRQMMMENKKEEFKAQQEAQKQSVNFILDVFKDPTKQTTENLKAVRDINMSLPKPVIPDTTIAGMYNQALENQTRKGKMQDFVNQRMGGQMNTPSSTINPSSPQTASHALPLGGRDKVAYSKPEEIPYYDLIKQAGDKYQIKNLPLFTSMIHAESTFNPKAISPKGAIGIAQVMPGTARDMGITDPQTLRNPAVGIDAGANYFKQMEDRFGSDKPELIAAAYNAGPEAVTKYGGVPPYKETRGYVQRVNNLHGQYSQLMSPSVQSPPTTGNVTAEQASPPLLPGSYDVSGSLGMGMGPGEKLRIDKDMNPSFEFTAPTMNEQEAAMWEKLSPTDKMQYLDKKWAKDTGQEPISIQWKGADGVLYHSIKDPRTGRISTTPIGKAELDPNEKIEMEAKGAGYKRQQEAIAGVTPLPNMAGKTAGQLEAEAKGPPEKLQEAFTEANAKVKTFERFNRDIIDIGTDKSGKFHMNNLPVGPWEKYREVPEKMGITQTKFQVDRAFFVEQMTNAISDLYRIGGKQLSDKEIDKLKAYDLNPDIPVHEWISKAALLWEKGLDQLEAQIEQYEKQYDVSSLRHAYDTAKEVNPWYWLPPDLRPKRLQPKGE